MMDLQPLQESASLPRALPLFFNTAHIEAQGQGKWGDEGKDEGNHDGGQAAITEDLGPRGRWLLHHYVFWLLCDSNESIANSLKMQRQPKSNATRYFFSFQDSAATRHVLLLSKWHSCLFDRLNKAQQRLLQCFAGIKGW